jgi:hypothetical protein
MKIIARCFMILVILAGIVMPVFVIDEPVQAVGNTSVAINSTAGLSGSFGSYQTGLPQGIDVADAAWAYHVTTSAYIGGGQTQIGWGGYLLTAYNPDIHDLVPKHGVVGFNLSTIPVGAELISANFTITSQSKVDTSSIYNDFYWSAYKTNIGVDHTVTVDDVHRWSVMRAQGYGRVTAPQHFTSVANGYSFPITKDLDMALERYDSTNMTYFDFMPENLALNWVPSWENNKEIYFNGSFQLNVTYTAPATRGTVTIHTNAAVDTTVLGTETASNITLETLRCMYADETLSFLINGESGANVTMQLVDENDAVIATHTDSIRTDNIYAYQTALTPDFSGFVKLRETNFNLESDWVSVQPSPASSEVTNTLYAGSTVHPQYTTPFSSYVVYDDDYMYIHYKTNLNPATELSSYKISLYSRGTYTAWTSTMSTLASSYFGGSVANQQALSHWRYVVFTPAFSSAGKSYGGLVNNLQFDTAITLRTGFIQAKIQKISDSTVLADSHSAYWSQTATDGGLTVSLGASKYGTDENPVINFTVGNECKIESTLFNGTAHVSAGGTDSTFTPVLGTQQIKMAKFTVEGVHTISFILSLGSEHSYQYRYDMTVTITAAGEGSSDGGTEDANSLWALLKKIIGLTDTSSASSHWILLIVGMGILVALFWFSEVLRVVFPLLLFGAACVAGWIDRWWVILLALGAGVYLFSLFKKKTGSGAE